jgi:hypothetical protein
MGILNQERLGVLQINKIKESWIEICLFLSFQIIRIEEYRGNESKSVFCSVLCILRNVLLNRDYFLIDYLTIYILTLLFLIILFFMTIRYLYHF